MCKHLHRAVNIICLIALAQYTTLQQKNPLNQRASLFYLVGGGYRITRQQPNKYRHWLFL